MEDVEPDIDGENRWHNQHELGSMQAILGEHLKLMCSIPELFF